ncbi:solute carrier family 40 member 1-like [Psammomys obesus]|uniref:solute carrier family 40 member 1-like n=1 Tax=Psammomys obesus TaxID=48139 RepID=UPI002452C0E2|nr:solute carrier family 40 member 1-like [Psammomys obesus]
MVGKSTDIENSGNEERQTKASDNRRTTGEMSTVERLVIASSHNHMELLAAVSNFRLQLLMGMIKLVSTGSSGSKGGGFLDHADRGQLNWRRMWHFAMSVFLIELYGHNLLLTAVFGLAVAGSVLIFGVLIGDWIDRKPRNEVAHASLFIQNASGTACCVVLMLVFSYQMEMELIWHGWLTVACYAVVISLAAVTNLAGTALTITIQRDWIVSLTRDNRGQLAGVNAAMRQLDQVISIFTPLSVGQVMAWASHVIGCGFILGWNLVSLLVEFLFLSRVYQLVPQLAVKPQRCTAGCFLERQRKATPFREGPARATPPGSQDTTCVAYLAIWEDKLLLPILLVNTFPKAPELERGKCVEESGLRLEQDKIVYPCSDCFKLESPKHVGVNRDNDGETEFWGTMYRFTNNSRTLEKLKDRNSSLEEQRATTKGLLHCLHGTRRLLHTCREGWETYCRQTVFLAGLGLAFLYMTVLGFDCITTGYAHTQGIGGSLLSILTALSAVSGLTGTILFTRLRKHYGLVTRGVISSWLHLGSLTLCVFSVFAPESPFDMAAFYLPLSKNSSSNQELLKDDQARVYTFRRNLNQPIFPDRSPIHWTNNTVLFDGQQDPEQPESYMSIILLFSGVILARIGLWSFDLSVTQLLQENIPEAERGAVNGVQCSLNYLMDLIHFILVMLAPRPQQFGMLVFLSMLFVGTGHVLYFFYSRRSKKATGKGAEIPPT